MTFEVGSKEEARDILNNDIYVMADIIKEVKMGRYSERVEG